MKKRVVLTAFIFVLIILFGIFIFRSMYARETIVTKVISRPNMVEDGFYGIYVTDLKTKQEYLINATGYMNTPIPPSERGERCLTITNVSVGQKVQFNLPEVPKDGNAEPVDTIFENCYKIVDPKALTYFFNVSK
ncbi:hypothetical protein BH11PAT1_BH11PAT1_2950 [soil metagenome]